MGRSCAGNYVALRLLVPAVCSMLIGDQCLYFVLGMFVIAYFVQKWSPFGSWSVKFVVKKACEISDFTIPLRSCRNTTINSTFVYLYHSFKLPKMFLRETRYNLYGIFLFLASIITYAPNTVHLSSRYTAVISTTSPSWPTDH